MRRKKNDRIIKMEEKMKQKIVLKRTKKRRRGDEKNENFGKKRIQLFFFPSSILF